MHLFVRMWDLRARMCTLSLCHGGGTKRELCPRRVYVAHRSWSPWAGTAGRRSWRTPTTGRCKASWCSPAAPTWTGWHNAETERLKTNQGKKSTLLDALNRTLGSPTSWSSPARPPSCRTGSVKESFETHSVEAWRRLLADANVRGGARSYLCFLSHVEHQLELLRHRQVFLWRLLREQAHICMNVCMHSMYVCMYEWTFVCIAGHTGTGSGLTMGSETSGTMLHWILQPLQDRKMKICFWVIWLSTTNYNVLK